MLETRRQGAEKIAIAVLSLKECSKALALVPVPGPLASGKIVDILVNMAKQLRLHNVSLTCKKLIARQWGGVIGMACIGL